MKIIRLQGENFKRMTAFDITPNGNTVVIAGKNAQGKTSVLDSIAMLFEGKKGSVAKATPRPIKDGAATATLIAETEKFIVKKKWTDNDHEYLEITSKDGTAHFASPQKMLDEIVGDLSFDPLEFTRLKPKEQRELLLGIVNITIDLNEWDQKHTGLMEQRKVVGRDADALKGKMDTMASYPADTPDTEVSVADIAKQLQEAEAHNRAQHLATDKVAASRALVEKLENELAGARALLKEAEQEHAKLGGAMPTSQFQEQIAAAETTNKAVRIKRERMEAEQAHHAKSEEYERMTKELEGMRTAKENALKSATFPIAELGITDDGVTFKGVPLSQCSSAEQLKISMAIAMARNPELRVIRITDGSLLDEDNMKVVEEMAQRNDFQIWVEKVDSSGTVGIVIEDGKIISNHNDGPIESQ